MSNKYSEITQKNIHFSKNFEESIKKEIIDSIAKIINLKNYFKCRKIKNHNDLISILPSHIQREIHLFLDNDYFKELKKAHQDRLTRLGKDLSKTELHLSKNANDENIKIDAKHFSIKIKQAINLANELNKDNILSKKVINDLITANLAEALGFRTIKTYFIKIDIAKWKNYPYVLREFRKIKRKCQDLILKEAGVIRFYQKTKDGKLSPIKTSVAAQREFIAQQIRHDRFLKTTYIKKLTKDGRIKLIPLKELCKTDKHRLAENLNIIEYFNATAEEREFIPLFFTVTLEGKYHANPKHNNSPEKIAKSLQYTAQEMDKFLKKKWQKARNELNKNNFKMGNDGFGVWTSEAHNDATPHMHFIMWIRPRCQETLLRILKKVYQNGIKRNPSTAKDILIDSHGLNVKLIEQQNSKSAIRYVFKYVAKAQGFLFEDELKDKETLNKKNWNELENDLGQQAWFKTHNIRSIQSFGLENKKTLWNRIRQLGYLPTDKIMEAYDKSEADIMDKNISADIENTFNIFAAAGAGDFTGFMRLTRNFRDLDFIKLLKNDKGTIIGIKIGEAEIIGEDSVVTSAYEELRDLNYNYDEIQDFIEEIIDNKIDIETIRNTKREFQVNDIIKNGIVIPNSSRSASNDASITSGESTLRIADSLGCSSPPEKETELLDLGLEIDYTDIEINLDDL